MVAIRHIVATKAPNKNKKYSIIIPAAGMGTRMITYGVASLIHLSPQRTVLDRQIAIIDKVFSQYEIILVTGFQHDKIFKYAPKHIIQVYNKHYQNTNTAYSIKLGLQAATTNNVVIIHGDLVFNKALLTVPFDRDPALVICDKMKKDEVGCILHNKMVMQVFYGLSNKWAQVAYLTGPTLDAFKNLVNQEVNYKCFTFEMINRLLDTGYQIKALTPKGARAIDIDTSKDINPATKIR